MAKIYLYSYEPIEVESLEDYTLPNTTVKMVKIKGKMERQNYTQKINPETKQYEVVPNPEKVDVEIIVPVNRIIKYEE